METTWKYHHFAVSYIINLPRSFRPSQVAMVANLVINIRSPKILSFSSSANHLVFLKIFCHKAHFFYNISNS